MGVSSCGDAKTMQRRGRNAILKQFGGRQKNRRTSFVYTYFEAFVLLVAALAPFTSFAARTARPLADYQRWNS